MLALLAAVSVSAGPPPFVWLEGEAAAPASAAAWGRTDRLSGGKLLSLDPSATRAAAWPFTAPVAGRYRAWVRVGFAGEHAAFRWRVAGRPWTDVPGDSAPHDPVPLDDDTPLGWLDAGPIDLTAGPADFEVTVPRGPGRFALDAVCLVAGDFRPDGANKPGQFGRTALDAEAGRGFEFPPPGPALRRTVELSGTWQAARWDEVEVADRAAPVAELPPDLDGRPWRGVRVPGELAAARPDWALCHRFLLRTRFLLPDAPGRAVRLDLPAVDLFATVFVNGRRIGVNPVPHAPAGFDLTAAVRPGWNDLVIAVKDHYYAAVAPWPALRTRSPSRFPPADVALDWPVVGSRRGGLLEPPTLTLLDPVSVADVFVRPRPSAGRVAADVTVRNTGPTPRTVGLRAAIRPTETDGRVIRGTPAMAFAPATMTVPAGGTVTPTFTGHWATPRLWWPDDPVQYALEVTLTDAGQPVDELTSRFGVCEWATAGNGITLNGVTWRLTADRRHESSRPVPLALQAVKDWRANGVTAVRLAGERPWTDDPLGFLSAAGVPVWRAVADTPSANGTAYAVARVRAERNSPAVAFWELPPGVDLDAIRAADPTRPVLPHESPTVVARDWPGTPTVIRPTALTLSVAAEPPSFFASVGGERAFLGSSSAAPAADRLGRLLADGSRWGDPAAVRLDAPTLPPVAVLVKEWDATAPAGKPLIRTLMLVNDTRVGTPITVHWLFRAAGSVTEVRGKRVVKLPPGGRDDFALTLDVPATATAAELVLTCEREGREVFRDIRPLRVVGPPPAVDLSAVAVFDPANKLPGFEAAVRLTNPFAPPAGCRVLVVGPDAVPSSLAADPRWQSLAAAGLRVVVFDQSYSLHGPAVPAEVVPTSYAGRFAFPADPTHPAFAGLSADDFAGWAEPVYRRAYRPCRNARPLAECDTALSLTPLAEVPAGNGLMLLCQLGGRAHPVGRRLAANLVNYALAWERPAKPTAALLPADARRRLLANSGLLLRSAEDVPTALATARVVVLDGTAAHLSALSADPDGLDRFFAAGGWVVAWGVGPDAEAGFNRLVGVDHLWRPFRRERVTPDRRDPLAGRLRLPDLIAADGGPLPGTFTRVVDTGDVAPFAAGPPPWDRMTDGLTAGDHPREAVHVSQPPGAPRPVWAGRLPRREAVTGLGFTVNADHRPLTAVRVTFDDDPAALTVRLTPGHQEVAVNPPRTCSRVGIEPLNWANTGEPVIGLDEVNVRVKRDGAFVPLAGGGLVKYPRGAGGVVLCQLRAAADDPPETTARQRRLVLGLLRGLGAEFAPEPAGGVGLSVGAAR